MNPGGKRGGKASAPSGMQAPAAKEDWRDGLRRVVTTRGEYIKAGDLPAIQTAIKHTQQKIFAVQNQLNNPKFANRPSLVRQLDRHGNVDAAERRLADLRAKEGYALRLNGAANGGQVAAGRVPNARRANSRAAAKAGARAFGYYVK
jgi:hypothetical protein